MAKLLLLFIASFVVLITVLVRFVSWLKQRSFMAVAGLSNQQSRTVFRPHRQMFSPQRYSDSQARFLADPSRKLTKAEAEELLDWLENHGKTGQVSYQAGRGFTVE